MALRSEGRSFGAIARVLGYDQARDATVAFHRGLRRRPEPDRSMLREQELKRLDVLAQQLRETATGGSDADLERTLRALERLRAMLLED